MMWAVPLATRSADEDHINNSNAQVRKDAQG
jgi:hypothetical protein